MAALRVAAMALMVTIAAPAKADSVSRWQPYITEASQRFGIPEGWIYKVMRAESGGQTHRKGRPIRSRVGAMGLLQIMPGTWGELRARYGLGSNPDDPRDNIMGGSAYLREMYDRFGYPGLFAAYNAGPARYAAYRAGRSRLPSETISYVASITGGGSLAINPAAGSQDKGVEIAAAIERPKLFVTVQGNAANDPTSNAPPYSSTLFVTLNSAQRQAE